MGQCLEDGLIDMVECQFDARRWGDTDMDVNFFIRGGWILNLFDRRRVVGWDRLNGRDVGQGCLDLRLMIVLFGPCQPSGQTISVNFSQSRDGIRRIDIEECFLRNFPRLCQASTKTQVLVTVD